MSINGLLCQLLVKLITERDNSIKKEIGLFKGREI